MNLTQMAIISTTVGKKYSLRRNGVALIVNKRVQNGDWDVVSKMIE